MVLVFLICGLRDLCESVPCHICSLNVSIGRSSVIDVLSIFLRIFIFILFSIYRTTNVKAFASFTCTAWMTPAANFPFQAWHTHTHTSPHTWAHMQTLIYVHLSTTFRVQIRTPAQTQNCSFVNKNCHNFQIQITYVAVLSWTQIDRTIYRFKFWTLEHR